MTEDIQKHLVKLADAVQGSLETADIGEFGGESQSLNLPENFSCYINELFESAREMPALSYNSPNRSKNLSIRLDYRRAYKMQRHFYNHIASNRAALDKIRKNKVPYNLNVFVRFVRFLGKSLPALRA
jgi:hypothetical protein